MWCLSFFVGALPVSNLMRMTKLGCSHSVLITMLQIDDAAQDPFIRWTILYAVVFALLSLVYGCILVVHFSGTRSTLLFKGWLQWIIGICRFTIDTSLNYSDETRSSHP